MLFDGLSWISPPVIGQKCNKPKDILYVIVKTIDVGRVGVCMVCTYVCEEWGDWEGSDSESLSLLSYIL